MRQHINRFSGYIWEKILSGGGWTFGCILLAGVVVAFFLSVTVHSRPVEQIQTMRQSGRIYFRIRFWMDHGFLKHLGLHFSDPPESHPNAMVYKSIPPASSYPLYLMNLLNYWIRGETFNLRLYVLYTQAILWISASCLGYLGFRLAKRLGASPLLAIACGVTGQAIFHTFPYNLQKYFEPTSEEFACLFLLCFLIIEESDRASNQRLFQFLRGLCVFLMAYFNKALTVSGLGTYFLAIILLDEQKSKKIGQLFVAICLGSGLHLTQLGWAKLLFPEISLVGTTFLWRSGLDGATNHVEVLTPDKLGANDVFLRNIGVLAIVIILWFFLKGGQQILKRPILLLIMTIGFYMVPGYLLSQWAMIHPYEHDIFLAVVSILAFCFILVPYLERTTGNTGIITWFLVILGFCFCMYQLRRYAIAYPLSLPEPDWKLYWPLG